MIRKYFDKISKILVVIGMILSMCFSAGNISVNAWDGNIPHEFTKVKSISYPEWWKRKCPQITKQWSTYMCKYNGQWSYCLEASKKTPAAGNYTASVIENNVMVRKFLYYGFGGPAQCLFKGQALTDDGLNEEETGYLYTHVLLSLAYSGDMCGANIDDLEKAGIGLKSTWQYVEGLPDPSNGASFSTGNSAAFSAVFDKNNMIQKTNSVKFNASSNETVQLPLQSNVTIHIEGTSTQQTGGTAAVYGGQSFYLTAPLKNSPSDYESGTLNSSAKGKFCALAISSGNSASQTHGSWAQESIDSLKYSVNWLDFGYIDLHKKSANETMTNGNTCYTLEGAKYGIYSENTLVGTLTTDKNGYAKSDILPVGKYIVKETDASTGYDIDEEIYNVTVVKDQTVTANSNEKPKNDPIGIEIVKNDAETLGEPQGDATLEDAEFTVKYYNKEYDKDNLPSKATRTWVLKTKKQASGKYIAGLAKSFLKEGSDELYYDDENPCLPLGTISIEETKAPKGYLLKGYKLTVTDTATGKVTSVTDGKFVAKITKEYKGAKLQFGNDANQMVVQEKVKKQKVTIFKSGYRNGISEVVKGLQGASFTFKLKSEVDHVGWDSAKVYDVITTDENGWAITKDLPYGEYLVRETVTPKDFYTNPDFTVSITQDTSEIKKDEDKVKKVILNNRPAETQLKLVKKDQETGKNVSLNSASFKIVADEDILEGGKVVYKKGQTITQKVGGKKYDTFTTNSKNVVIVKTEYTNDDDDKGEVFLPLQFFAGKYHLEEVKVPEGFIGLGKTQSFEMTGLLDFSKDEDGDPIYTVTVKDEQPKGSVHLTKTVDNLDTDTDLVDRSDLSKIQFVLKAKDDIYSPVDGTLMFAKDEKITTESSGAIVNTGTEIGKGIYALSKDGQLDISNLPMGTGEAKYYFEEVKTLDGCVLDEAKQSFTFRQKDFTTKNYSKDLNVENKTTHFEFNKTDVTGDKEVLGAQLTITDEIGNIVDQWVSTEKPHSIEGLVVGETYTLSETVTAKDYVKASDIRFTVKSSSELETVTMKDKQVSFTKTDITGEKEVEGATITVKEKETGNIVDEWISTKESHFINGLEEGKTYILSETVSPEGYVKSTDIEFTVSKDKVDQKVNMKDKQVIISKSMVGGDEVVGSSMQILDEEGNVVDEWISEGKEHYASNLEEGHTYTLHEDLAPTGLNLANDIVFAVTEEKENQKVEMVDTVNQVSKVKEDGTLLKDAELTVVSMKTKQIVDKWISGQHIFDLTDDMKSQLAENGKVGMYVDDEDSTVTYSISKNKDDYTLMIVKDGVTTYSNIDLDGNETTHRIEGLVAGETYILRETKTPDGYATFEEQEFIADENKDTLLKMTDEDTKVEVSKQDITTKKELPGAHLKVTDEEGNTVDEWVSKEESHIIKNLVAGKSYTLTETIAPAKYKIAESVNFKVEDTGAVQKVIMYDELLPEAAKVVKTGDNTRAIGYVLMGLGCFVFALLIFKHKDE
ncbi:SpaA isopeptide-forming pilin-related protein [Faecalibacillus intestinalis]|uniref:SpaA isopeptide-forming pilin-related protein n=1 Tax=Faecalibacillus intestinalis TaxID=1982626 RepID=UPI00295E344B|nr:SpaA isopeptide-forming pilin-related protein [Faecalibacillus intestinalis]